MRSANVALPDVMLLLDVEGVIRDATLANGFASEGVSGWVGRPWAETVSPADADGLKRMVADARTHGVCGFRNVLQRFPSGIEIPIEYTAVRLGTRLGLVAVGKNLRAVAELQSRLVEAQQAMERDYWKLREVETRYRLLFNSSSEAVLVLRSANLAILDLNPAAADALGVAPIRHRPGHELCLPDLLMEQERDFFEAMIRRTRERGKAPGILLRLGEQRMPWLLRASLVGAGEEILVQLAPSAAAQGAQDPREPVPVDELLEEGPDGFVVIDREGRILRANRAFADLVQMGLEAAVLGERLGRWLGRPGADLTVLLANVVRLGTVRLFATTLRGELGSEIEAEISATGRIVRGPDVIGVFIRDVSRRLPGVGARQGLDGVLDALARQVGKTSLRRLVEDTVALVERRYIEATLDLTGGNRTAAAELLGLSRQSLYVKLGRYGLEADPRHDPASG